MYSRAGRHWLKRRRRSFSARPTRSAALTAEFRAPRGELSAAAAASLRLQMLVSRLQAEEQRIIYLDRLRSEVAVRRSAAKHGRNEVAMRTLQQIQAEETDAVNALAQEQGRRNGFYARLDEMEGALTQR